MDSTNEVSNLKRYEPTSINLENKNSSHSLAIEMVGHDKQILEVGTSTGYITRILKQWGNRVIGIEIDKDAGEIARQYCESIILGDIENLDLDKYIEPSSIDVILLGDILEHLKWPGSLLRNMRKYLKPDGYLVVSLPNFCHGDIILTLMNGDFRYNSTGLLDETHFRFFGRRNVISIFDKYGYNVKDLNTVCIPIGATELGVDINKLPSEILKLINALPDSDVYQFVFKAMPTDRPFNESVSDVDFNKVFCISIEEVLRQHDAQKAVLSQEIVSLSEQLQRANAHNAALSQEISMIKQSVVWQMTMKIHTGFIERAFPHGTKRRRRYDQILKDVRILASESRRGFLPKSWRRLAKLSPANYKKGESFPFKAEDDLPININDPTNAFVLVSHDARKGGASQLALYLAKCFKEDFGKEVIIILQQSGPLFSSFEKYGQVICLQQREFSFLDNTDYLETLVAKLRRRGIKLGIFNTTTSGCLLPSFKRHGFYIISLVHELPNSIEILGITESARNIAQYSDKIVFSSEFVKHQFVTKYCAEQHKTVIKPQGLFRKNEPIGTKEHARQMLRQMIGAEDNAFIILGCGLGDLRKGIDIFIQVAGRILKQVSCDNIYFIWLGTPADIGIKKWAEYDIKTLGIESKIQIFDYMDDPIPVFSGSDVFLLTSREDPFPSVVLDAINADLPVIAFKDAGGIPEILGGGKGIVVPYLDLDSMASSAIELFFDKDKRKAVAEKAKSDFNKKFDFVEYARFLLNFLDNNKQIVSADHSQFDIRTKRVSVIIPNYNYKDYLSERLSSILNQTYKPYEIIFLDDSSTDNSIETARLILEKAGIKVTILENPKNEGVFRQWIKGIRLAEGELVWIAEADDFCDQKLLERIVPRFEDERVNLAYAQSQIVDERSRKIDYSYTTYTGDLSQDKWNESYCQCGSLELNEGLAIKNTIPNASAVVIRKSALIGIEDILTSFKICGDWLAYAYVLRNGKVSFCSEILNYHRRHSKSVINISERSILFYQELFKVSKFILSNYILRSEVYERMRAHLIEEYEGNGCNGQSSTDIDQNPVLSDELQDLDRLAQRRTIKQKQEHRIMIVVPDLDFGGGQLFGIRLANFLSNTNRVILYNARPFLENEKVKENISPCVELHSGDKALTQVSAIIDKYKIDTVISHVWWADKLVYSSIKNRKVKWLLVMHGCYEALVEHPDWDKDFPRIARPLLKRADYIVYTANKNFTAIESIDSNIQKNKCIKINNGFLRRDASIKISRNKFGLKDGDFAFGLISRAIPEKGWEQGILATKSLNEILNDNRVHLFLIGESEYAEQLKKSYSKYGYIHFLGFQEDLTNWIAMFDAGLLPTYFESESQPLIIIEFLAQKKPVIATDIGEIRNMLVHGNKQAGILIPIIGKTVSISELTQAMKRLVINEDCIYDMFRENSEELFKPYDMKRCAESYISLIEEKDRGVEK